MDVKVLILVGGDAVPAQQLAGAPVAFLDVLGEPVLQRVLDRLEHFGVSASAVVTDVPLSAAPTQRSSFHPGLRWVETQQQQFWRVAENVFNDFAQANSDIVLAIRLGPYAELDFEELIQFHLDKQCRITSVAGPDGEAIGTFAISASRRNDAAYLFRHEMKEMRTECEPFKHTGYFNPLREACQFRLLALDSFAGLNTIAPRGTEIKPGVWAGRNVRIHPKARVLAPGFIGEHSRVRASSLLTRGTVLEHHTEVDCGTVVENSTVLPMTCVGAGLDVTHSVLGFRRIWNLKHGVEVEIEDGKLVGLVRRGPRKVLENTARLTFFLPKVVSQAALGRRPKPQPELSEAVRRPAAALKNTADSNAGEEPLTPATDLISARRYGNE